MIKASNLWFGYSEEREKALSGVNFAAEKGEFIAVLGSITSDTSKYFENIESLLEK